MCLPTLALVSPFCLGTAKAVNCILLSSFGHFCSFVFHSMAAESRGPQIAAVGWAFVTISSVATILRIYCRGWVIKAFAADDWLAVAAQVCVMSQYSPAIY